MSTKPCRPSSASDATRRAAKAPIAPGWAAPHRGSSRRGAAPAPAGRARGPAGAPARHAWETPGWETLGSYVGLETRRSAKLAEKLGAVLDADAPQPKPDAPCLVYRHPRPETLPRLAMPAQKGAAS